MRLLERAIVASIGGVVLVSTASWAAAPVASEAPAWQPLFQGIHYAEVGRTDPVVQRAHAIRVDLREPGIRFLVTPSNEESPLETDSAKTSTFLKKHRCQVAINASPFDPVPPHENEPENILGLSVSEGDAYSAAHPAFASLVITRENTVRFAAPGDDVSDAYNAVGGFGLLLKDGENLGSGGERHPRTAAGLCADGRYLYLLVIDGRQPGYSEGATTAETAEWLSRLGAHEGLNLDGGGSSVLVISDEHGGPKVLNRPIHAHIPGTERPVGNHLGIFASPQKE